MKVYSFGDKNKPTLMLLPGTWCHWKSSFETVIPLLTPDFHVLCVSYDGFDETEPDETFPTMRDEVLKIEGYIKAECGGHIRAVYGCSLGGSFVGLLAARQHVKVDYGILGSSDLDQGSPATAQLMCAAALPLVYPLVHDGQFRQKFLQKRMEKRKLENPEYMDAFTRMFGSARPYVSKQSCKNQFYSDYVTRLPDHIDTATEIHVFYALKMGEKYRDRYQQHFAHPILHEHNMQHEELLVCHPQQWAALVKEICLKPEEREAQ